MVAGKIPALEMAQPEVTIEQASHEEQKKNSLSLQKHLFLVQILIIAPML